MHDPAVQEHVGDEPPPFTRERIRAEIRSVVNDDLTGELEKRAASERHGQKHRDVCAEENLCQAECRLVPPYPGCRNYPLGCIVTFLAPLGGFVLCTPLADPLPETQRRKLPTASNTVGHKVELIKSVAGD